MKKLLKTSRDDFLADEDAWNNIASGVSRVKSKTIAGMRNHIKYDSVWHMIF